MQYKDLTVEYSRTIQPRQYESVRATMTVTLADPPGDLENATLELWRFARNHVTAELSRVRLAWEATVEGLEMGAPVINYDPAEEVPRPHPLDDYPAAIKQAFADANIDPACVFIIEFEPDDGED